MVIKLKREFIIKKSGGKDMLLPDPNPDFSPQEVLNHYTSLYPSLNNAVINGPEAKSTKLIYTLSTSIGTKG